MAGRHPWRRLAAAAVTLKEGEVSMKRTETPALALALALTLAAALPAPAQEEMEPRPQAPASRVTLSGGAATFVHFERMSEEARYPETAYTRETTSDKELTYYIYWLDVKAQLNDALSFTGRLSNTNATRLWRWTMDGEPQDDLAWVAFQYAYVTVRTAPAEFAFGLLEVDRANEPLEVHYTPDRTAWTPYGVATRGSLKGVSIRRQLLGPAVDRRLPPQLRRSETLSAGADLTLGVHAEGTGKTTVESETVTPSVKTTYNWPSLDFILRFPIYRGRYFLEPVVALRSHADDVLKCDPDNGRGDWRTSLGFAGTCAFSPRVSARAGIGYSRFRNDDTRGAYLGSRVVGDQVVELFNAEQDNASLYLTLRPQITFGGNALIADVKYSVYENRAPERTFDTTYVNASLLWFWRYRTQLMLMPALRVYAQSYENPNEHERVDYSKVRICPQLLVAVTF